MKTREKIEFRLIRTPCCGHLLCWVNPRLPSHCPECGTMILSRLRPDVERSKSCSQRLDGLSSL